MLDLCSNNLLGNAIIAVAVMVVIAVLMAVLDIAMVIRWFNRPAYRKAKMALHEAGKHCFVTLNSRLLFSDSVMLVPSAVESVTCNW
jgi:hypothetical protein